MARHTRPAAAAWRRPIPPTFEEHHERHAVCTTRIKQKGSQCWAAAAAAWSAVAPNVRTRTADEPLKAGKSYKVVSSSGALRGDDGVEWLKRELDLQSERGTVMAVPPAKELRLKQGHVIYLYRKSSWMNSVHAEVVWGIDDELIDMMDPQKGKWTVTDWSLFDWSLFGFSRERRLWKR
jgi:hypothetical protein